MRDERWRWLGVGGIVAAGVSAEGSAAAFCRTTTCPLPADWSPAGECLPTSSFVDAKGNRWPDFATYCASQKPPAKVLPLFWRNACVSYDVQEKGSRWATYTAVVQIVDRAFRQWTDTTCADFHGDKVSVAASNLGPVGCDKVAYNIDQANQHVILFHDDAWPYDMPGASASAISASTLGLTTVTFDADTGEIYDADTEINGTVHLTTTTPVPADGYDLASIVTHEMGHFLGLAHSGEVDATMYAFYAQGSMSTRTLSRDDLDGLCSIYPPDHTRRIDPSVAPGGSVPAESCDLTPRHGFTGQCAQSPKMACAASPTDGDGGLSGDATWTAIAAFGVATLRRRTAASNVAR